MVDRERLARTVARVRQDVERLRALAATRDLVEDEVVRANVSLLGDLDAFTSALAAWAVRHG